MVGFNPATVDWSSPASFYTGSAELLDLADARIGHGAVELPVHSQVLAAQSAVLRELFRAQREQPPNGAGAGSSTNAGADAERTASGPAGSSKRRRTGGGAAQQAPIVLETPFRDHSLEAAVFLLRMLYCPADASAPNMAAVEAYVPSIIRLAHALDIRGPVPAAAEEFLMARMQYHEWVLQYLLLAESCHLDRAWWQGIRTLAQYVAAGPMHAAGHRYAAAGAFQAVDALRNLGSRALAAVLGTVGTACRRAAGIIDMESSSTFPYALMLPAFENPGRTQTSVRWQVPDLLLQHKDGRWDCLRSSCFPLAHRLWYIRVGPSEDCYDGDEWRTGRHLVLELLPDTRNSAEFAGRWGASLPDIVVKHRMDVVDEGFVSTSIDSEEWRISKFSFARGARGFKRLLRTDDVEARLGYLHAGPAVIRLEMQTASEEELQQQSGADLGVMDDMPPEEQFFAALAEDDGDHQHQQQQQGAAGEEQGEDEEEQEGEAGEGDGEQQEEDIGEEYSDQLHPDDPGYLDQQPPHYEGWSDGSF